ncbi:MAG: LacI family transcriptional regulator [Candidatus Dormibacteraeota bacterium]|nr:LacI family transcriptional regulator [Candidatus Dormibacteraeota bacterium]
MARSSGVRGSVTISEVAAHAGVSPATVSRVLNGGYPVAVSTRLQVERVVRELGYIRNAHAQALRGASTGVVGVIIHDVADPYFAEIVAGIQDVAAIDRRLVVLCNSLRDPEQELRYVEMLRGQRVSAIILAGGVIEDAAYLRGLRAQVRQLRQQDVRVIMCGRYSRLSTDVVAPDNRGGAEMLTRHLLDRGHRDIAEIMGPHNFSTTEERSLGHRQVLAAAGIERHPSLVVPGGFTRDGGHEAARAILGSGVAFSAIFAANDLMALGALAALREAGVRVPEDVSLVGFDDIPTVRDVVPGLTTVRVPMREMGRLSMHIALGARGPRTSLVVLPVELVERDSVVPMAVPARRLA